MHRQFQHRQSRLKKHGVKDENIDRQIRQLHSAMADKLLANPQQANRIKGIVEQRKAQGHLGYGAYLFWLSLLELIDQPEAFRAALLEDTPQMRRLRRQTPLVGLLNEQERQDALLADACGDASIDNVF